MQYIIKGYRTQDDAISGYGITTERNAYTLAQAKKDAKYVISREAADSAETSEILTYSTIENEAGEILFDFFA